MPHLLLKLKDAIHQRLAGRWTAWNVDIHWHYSVATPSHRVTVVIISTAIRATSHAYHPSWIRHLIVHLPQCRCHFVCERSRHDHHVRLSRRGPENDSKTILVISRCREVHHFDSAASETESHRPQGALPGPVCDLIESGSR